VEEIAPVIFELRPDGIAIVTLNRPEKRNAINKQVAELIAHYVREVENDDAVRVAILTGAGNVFCAGGDLAEMAAGKGDAMVLEDGGFAGFVFANRRKPWIAAAKGAILGGGLELCLACDLIVVGEGSTLGLPEVARGAIPAAGGVARLPSAIPRAVAVEMVLTGDPITAEQAARLGLVNKVVPDSMTLDRAVEFATRIARNAPLAVCGALDILRNSVDMTSAESQAYAQRIFARINHSADAQEGARAFMERRTPVWMGR
jgi:enoyl-CoA hydratase/carnithine racemase